MRAIILNMGPGVANEMDVVQFSGQLNRLHAAAIGKDEQAAIYTIEVTQAGEGNPDPDNIRPVAAVNVPGVGPVFGGSLDSETGVLTITWAGADMGTLTYVKGADTAAGNPRYNINGLPKKTGLTNLTATCYQTVSVSSVNDLPDFSIRGHASNNNVYLSDSRYQTAETIKAGLAGQYLVYELATPQEVQLTDRQLITLIDSLE